MDDNDDRLRCYCPCDDEAAGQLEAHQQQKARQRAFDRGWCWGYLPPLLALIITLLWTGWYVAALLFAVSALVDAGLLWHLYRGEA